MRNGILVSILVLGITVLLAAGCATTGGGKDRASIDTTLAGWKAALEKQDIDALMRAYSESFQSSRGDNKAAVKEFLTGAKDQGYLDGAKADMSQTKITLEEGAALAAPIELSSNRGSITVSLTLKKDPDKVWRIISSESN